MSFVNFVVKRYIFTKRKFQFISFIAWLSVIGITIGVAALIIVMSIFNGFRELQKEQLTSKNVHLEIFSADKNVYDFTKEIDGVSSISLMNEKKVLISSGESVRGAKLLSYNNPDFLGELLKNDPELFKNENGIVVGGILAQDLKIFPGDKLKLISPDQIMQSAISYRSPKVLEKNVIGTIFTNSKENDASQILEYSNVPDDNFTSIAVRVANPNKIETIEKELKNYFTDLELSSWKDKNSRLLGIMEIERYSTFIILSLIVLIAAFNLFVSISMTALEKEKDIAIIRVVGARKNNISDIFFRLGFFTGSFGTIAGLAIGIIAVYTQMIYGWIPVANAQNVVMPDIPVKMNYLEILFAGLFSLLLTAISSYLPGRYILNRNIISGLAGDN